MGRTARTGEAAFGRYSLGIRRAVARLGRDVLCWALLLPTCLFACMVSTCSCRLTRSSITLCMAHLLAHLPAALLPARPCSACSRENAAGCLESEGDEGDSEEEEPLGTSTFNNQVGAWCPAGVTRQSLFAHSYLPLWAGRRRFRLQAETYGSYNCLLPAETPASPSPLPAVASAHQMSAPLACHRVCCPCRRCRPAAQIPTSWLGWLACTLDGQPTAPPPLQPRRQLRRRWAAHRI
jgi:hypothetical protein